MLSRVLLPGLILLVFVGGASAADPLARAELDKRVVKIVYDAELVGVELYNGGKHDECVRVYQATLMALTEVLDHRPEFVAKIKDGLDKTKAMGTSGAAFALRKLLDETSAICSGEKNASGKTPLWDRLDGGRRDNAGLVVSVYVQEFVAAIRADESLSFVKDGRIKLDTETDRSAFEKKLVQLISTATGGRTYDVEETQKILAGLHVTDAEYSAITRYLVAVLNKYKVKKEDQEEFLALVDSARNGGVGKKPLWDRLGGEPKVKAVVADFLEAASKDPKVNVDRNGNYPITKERGERVSQLLVEFVSSATGGPMKYTGRDMKNAHQGMKITDGEFQAMANHFIAALKKNNVPQPEIDELVATIAVAAKDIVEKK